MIISHLTEYKIMNQKNPYYRWQVDCLGQYLNIECSAKNTQYSLVTIIILEIVISFKIQKWIQPISIQ